MIRRGYRPEVEEIKYKNQWFISLIFLQYFPSSRVELFAKSCLMGLLNTNTHQMFNAVVDKKLPEKVATMKLAIWTFRIAQYLFFAYAAWSAYAERYEPNVIWPFYRIYACCFFIFAGYAMLRIQRGLLKREDWAWPTAIVVSTLFLVASVSESHMTNGSGYSITLSVPLLGVLGLWGLLSKPARQAFSPMVGTRKSALWSLHVAMYGYFAAGVVGLYHAVSNDWPSLGTVSCVVVLFGFVLFLIRRGLLQGKGWAHMAGIIASGINVIFALPLGVMGLVGFLSEEKQPAS